PDAGNGNANPQGTAANVTVPSNAAPNSTAPNTTAPNAAAASSNANGASNAATTQPPAEVH
ncbi:MAG: rod shape-determining protein MreC, partial [Shewanella sp.]